MLDQAFEALNSYDWGVDPKVLQPIDDAVVASHGDPAASKALEARLAQVLEADVSRSAKDYACRKLRLIGTKESVPALAALLPQKEHSHMARFALERIPAIEATQALRKALPQVAADLQIGVISSLGVRQDAESVTELATLLSAADIAVSRAAAFALGAIGSLPAAKALADAKLAPEATSAATDASLSCAEALLADGNKAAALIIYKALAGAGESQPKHVRLAATRGILACAGKSS